MACALTTWAQRSASLAIRRRNSSARLNAELKGILALPDVKAAFETQGMSPAHSSTDEFRRLIASDAERWAQVVKAQGIQAD